MIGLPYGEENMTTCQAVSIEYRNMTNGQTDGHIDRRTYGQNCYINIVRRRANAR